MPHTQLGRHRIHYELQGQTGTPVLIFVNGLTQSTPLWASYAAYFAPRGYRVLTYDLLGQGQSSKPVLSIEIGQHVDLLEQLLGMLGIESCCLAGVSFGGVVALRFAIEHPTRVSGLVAMSTFSELTPQLELLGRALYEGLTQAGLPHLQNLLLPMNFSSAWLAEHRDVLPELKRRGYVTNDLYAVQNLVESFVDFKPFSAELSRIACPTLIMNGEWDYLTPRVSHEILRRGIASSRLMIIQHAYHAFTLEFPQIVARVIEDFLRSVENGSWRGNQSVWVAADDPEAAVIATPCRGDHTRAVPLDLGTGAPESPHGA